MEWLDAILASAVAVAVAAVIYWTVLNPPKPRKLRDRKKQRRRQEGPQCYYVRDPGVFTAAELGTLAPGIVCVGKSQRGQVGERVPGIENSAPGWITYARTAPSSGVGSPARGPSTLRECQDYATRHWLDEPGVYWHEGTCYPLSILPEHPAIDPTAAPSAHLVLRRAWSDRDQHPDPDGGIVSLSPWQGVSASAKPSQLGATAELVADEKGIYMVPPGGRPRKSPCTPGDCVEGAEHRRAVFARTGSVCIAAPVSGLPGVAGPRELWAKGMPQAATWGEGVRHLARDICAPVGGIDPADQCGGVCTAEPCGPIWDNEVARDTCAENCRRRGLRGVCLPPRSVPLREGTGTCSPCRCVERTEELVRP